MELSELAQKVKKFYDMHLYDKHQVQAFADKGKITQSEVDEILNGNA